MTTPNRASKIAQVIQKRQQGVIVFEDIYDPHNAAAVLRTMDGFGFQTAYFIFEKTQKYSPRQVGRVSSSSANKWLTIKSFTSSRQCMEELKGDGYTTYATHLYPERQINLYSPSIPTLGPQIALIFGNEHSGVSEYTSSQSDYHLHIPMAGFVESFNISVCAALVLGEITRKRSIDGMEKYLLTSDQQDRLKSQWLTM
ncbi:MAG: RNA methyltransferase [Candidatus Roizmanbacteria bacterium]